MQRISLVNMPFANLGLPSIALTQLKSVIEARFRDKVSVEVLYLNHDFAKYLGMDLYDYLTNSMESLNTGLGDWFFRQVAFPELPDNTALYLGRYFPGKGRETQRIKDLITNLRPGLGAFMERLAGRYQLGESHMVGFTSMFMQNTASFGMARTLKRLNPALTTVIGGANCEFPMGGVIAKQVEGIDFVFSGPGLKSFPEFVSYWLEGDTSKCQSIRGVFCKEAHLPKSGPETIGEDLSIDTPIDLDYEPFMNRFEEYFPDVNANPSLSFETSRGCWWGERAHCTFCGLNGISMAYRAMKPDLAIELFNTLFRYSGRVTRLTAVDNILPKNYLEQVFPFLETPGGMEIFYEVKADLSERDIAVLAKARVTQIQPGIEALATSTLKLMKKGTTAFQNINLLKMCVLYGIKPHWNLLLGFPGEGNESYRRYVETLPFLTHLYPPSGAFPVRFDRFSPYFQQPQSYGLDLYPLDFYFLIYPFDEAEIRNFAYYFADRNIMAEYFTTMAKWISKVSAKVNEWQARWNEVSGGALPPQLCFKGDSTIVYDSRRAPAMWHSIGETGKAILLHLVKPTRSEELIKVFSPSGIDVATELESLEAKGLVFREGDRFLSLVMDNREESHQGVESSLSSTSV